MSNPYFASCMTTRAFFHTLSRSLVFIGGKENMLTVELRVRISCKTLSAEYVSLKNMFSMFFISASCWGTLTGLSPQLPPGSLSGSVWYKRWLRSVSHSFTSLFRTSVSKNGSLSTFWMKGNRISSPLSLSYFFKIFTTPVDSKGNNINSLQPGASPMGEAIPIISAGSWGQDKHEEEKTSILVHVPIAIHLKHNKYVCVTLWMFFQKKSEVG